MHKFNRVVMLTILALSLACIPQPSQAASVGFGSNSWYTDTLASHLRDAGHTTTVYDYYDAATLSGLDVYIQDGNSYFDASLLENFVYGGGVLIQIPHSISHYDYSANTIIMTQRTDVVEGILPGITILDPANWLLTGVTVPVDGGFYGGREEGNNFVAGVTEVLDWADGTSMLGYRGYGAGLSIAFNLHLITSDYAPLDADWSNRIILNAIGFNGDAPLPTPEPSTFLLLGAGLLGLAAVGRKRIARG